MSRSNNNGSHTTHRPSPMKTLLPGFPQFRSYKMSSASSNTRSTIGVNGFGRIGRLVSRIVLTEQKESVAIGLINDPFMYV